MDYFIRFAQPVFLAVSALILFFTLFFRLFFYKSPIYCTPVSALVKTNGLVSKHPYRKILFFIRSLMLIILVLLIGKPQLVDSQSKAQTEGINIILVLDVSGSMNNKDYSDDERSRFDVAKEEAIRFTQTRPNDAIGVVLFGKDAVSRCPLTLDKKMLETIIMQTQLGIVDHEGTVLARGILTAANRLKNAKAKSNVMIVLTDGEPTPEDSDPAVATEIAKQLNIKIYTIGIGSDEDRVVMHPLFGVMAMPKVNKELLTKIAEQTGGKFFLARNAQDMRMVYKTIDALEKSEIETPVFTRYFDFFMPGVWLVLAMLIFEILLTTTIWFGI